jgi:hypothetical protein
LGEAVGEDDVVGKAMVAGTAPGPAADAVPDVLAAEVATGGVEEEPSAHRKAFTPADAKSATNEMPFESHPGDVNMSNTRTTQHQPGHHKALAYPNKKAAQHSD